MKSAHGIRGELFLKLKAKQADWSDDAETLSLLKAGASEPQVFEVEYLRPHKDGLIARLKGIPDRNAAESWAKSAVYLEEELLVSDDDDSIYLNQILNFEVVDLTLGSIGRIEGFASNGPQDLLRVRIAPNREALVPLVEAFIRDIDFDKKQVNMDLPPGLLNLEEE